MNEFQNNSCVVVRNLIDEATIKTISMYMEHKVRANHWIQREGEHDFDNDPANSAFSSYSDPLIEVVLKDSLPAFEEITGLELHPTYSYSRIYLKGQELKPHVDRPACEISATINVATVGKSWPIWMKVPGKDPFKVEMNPGDAVIYKGCEVTHWRDKAEDTDITVQFMLHYVDKNGPYSSHKWDMRPGLGYPGRKSLRSN